MPTSCSKMSLLVSVFTTVTLIYLCFELLGHTTQAMWKSLALEHWDFMVCVTQGLEKNLTAMRTEWEPSPHRLLGNQTSDLALHGVLDVARGVEAYRSVVGCADHLTLVIDVRCRNKRLSSTVVSSTNWFIFLLGREGNQVITETIMG